MRLSGGQSLTAGSTAVTPLFIRVLLPAPEWVSITDLVMDAKNATRLGCKSKKQPKLVAFFVLYAILTIEVNGVCRKITQH